MLTNILMKDLNKSQSLNIASVKFRNLEFGESILINLNILNHENLFEDENDDCSF